MNKEWGFHFIVDAGNCDVDTIKNKSHIKEFIKKLLIKTKMNPIGPPIFKYVKPTPQTIKNEIDGYSVVQIIVTSSVTIHFVNSTKMMFLDFFSCKKFKQEDVLELIKEYFNPGIFKTTYINRNTLT